ncbi:MAG: TIGR02594 family protein [Proteobacteria bacterium]|nr:TIGR02594 family protein [Pseudomonadota bacterium]
MKRSYATALVCSLVVSIATASSATTMKRTERFANVEPLETISRSRAEAADQAAQVPGGASILLEALRYRGANAKQLGLPAQLWCADFMNFVIKKAGAKGTHSRAARSFLEFGKRLDGPRVGAIAILRRGGPQNGHVGVVRGTDGQGNPILISGNSGNMVRQSAYPKEKVLAYVMPPDYVLKEITNAARAQAIKQQQQLP